MCHEWFTDHVNHPAAEEKSDGYCEKLHRVSAGIYSSLHPDRYRRTHDNVKARTHQRYGYITQNLCDTPCNRGICQRHQEVTGCQREQHGCQDKTNPNFRWRQNGRYQTADKHRNARSGSDNSQDDLPAICGLSGFFLPATGLNPQFSDYYITRPQYWQIIPVQYIRVLGKHYLWAGYGFKYVNGTAERCSIHIQ